VSAQASLQTVPPFGQPHVPLLQVRPPAHTVPQAPQFCPSVWRSMQAPLQ
jgi:hypothetical protein